MRSGKGKYFWDKKDRFEGEFENNRRNGKGVYYWPNGDWFEG